MQLCFRLLNLIDMFNSKSSFKICFWICYVFTKRESDGRHSCCKTTLFRKFSPQARNCLCGHNECRTCFSHMSGEANLCLNAQRRPNSSFLRRKRHRRRCTQHLLVFPARRRRHGLAPTKLGPFVGNRSWCSFFSQHLLRVNNFDESLHLRRRLGT